jgi:sortase B
MRDLIKKAANRFRGAAEKTADKQKPARGKLWSVAFVVCAGVMLFSGYKLIEGQLEYKRADDVYANIGTSFVKPPPAFTPTPAPSQTEPQPQPTRPSPGPAAPSGGETPPDEPEEPVEPSYIDEPAPDYWPVVDFEGLRGINSGSAAWLLCPGTNVNYPVVQGQDNDYYLTHMFDHTRNSAGSLFIDYKNSAGFTDRNTIIYGHHMRNHSMFWTLTQYKSQWFYNSHPAFRLLTPEGNYEIQLFAGYVANVNDDAWRTYFTSDEDFLAWLSRSWERSTFAADVPLTAEDRIVTLSTCTYDFKDARYVLLGKLVPVVA